ncbi:MAG: ABC transporter permease [Bacteroidales bacterium]|nr:ABC transporter permease [Bacteroidales bacterium]MCF8390046.1 ABC transporter permease [Bacteroidales bacterium]
MNIFKLILRNLSYYKKKNLALALGVAISAAILTGALIVGDSVKYSLNRIVAQRLGNVTHVLKSGDRYFTSDLAGKMSQNLNIPVSGLLVSNGSAVADGGQKRIPNVQILGVDENFDILAGTENFYEELGADEVILSTNLANRLGVSVGEDILIRMTKASLIPLNAPFVSDDENIVSSRLKVKDLAGTEQMGMFNLKNSQTAPFNAFVSKDFLSVLMEFENKSNLLLLSGNSNTETIKDALKKVWSVEDAGIILTTSENSTEIDAGSERVFIDDAIAGVLKNIPQLKFPVFSYFVNSLNTKTASTPYSFVSTIPDKSLEDTEVIINEWLAADLKISKGDTINIEYFVVGPLRALKEDSVSLRVKLVVAPEGYFADKNLMPNLPGLSDAGSCSDWESGVPIDLKAIRDKDEEYWNKYKGTPKAFISFSLATKLWINRFGSYTAFRYSSEEISKEELARVIIENLEPEKLGFQIENVREKGEFAAGNGVDFGELFGGLSFFLLMGGILLTVLLFLLNLENRKDQLQTLSTLGIPLNRIRKMMLSEGMAIAFLGSVAGIFLAILYNELIFSALNGVWKDIVRSDMMVVHIQPETIVKGFLLTLLVSFLTIVFPLNRFLKTKLAKYKKGKEKLSGGKRWISLSIASITGFTGIALIISQFFRNEIINSTVFFAAGGLLLISGIYAFHYLISGERNKSLKNFSLEHLSWNNTFRNKMRSLSIVLLFAIGTFLVISTGSNKKDLFVNANDLSSGTGGFLYFAESTIPVLHDLNDPAVKFDFGFENNYSFVQLRKFEGDDASCLNLNKISNPGILGVNPETLQSRFKFVTKTPYLDESDPWLSLNQDLPGNAIPAIADETVIKWGLGLKVGDSLEYLNSEGESMQLLLIGGLAPSIFQGSVLISNKYFLEQFPQNSGTHTFLIEGNSIDTAEISSEINNGMRDLGWDMNLSANRLAEFNSVTNTYLSIFLVLGALGLLLGTIGLAIVLFRSILERKQEIALFRAIGFSKTKIRKHIIIEYMILLLTGIVIGFISAVIATLPSILSPNTEVSFSFIVLLLIILLLNALLWTFGLATVALKDSSIVQALRNE